MEEFRNGSENMSKKYVAIMLIAIMAMAFTLGCVQQRQNTGNLTNQTNRTYTETAEQINENDNLEPALQELGELEGL